MSQLRLQVRRGKRAMLPDLAEGELGFASDTREVFIGTAGAENVQVSTAPEVAAGFAAHRVEAGAHDVGTISGAETPAGAQTKVDAHAGAVTAHAVAQITGAESVAGAQAKVDAHAGAATAHDVTQVAGAVASGYLTANYYGKAEADGRFMAKGMPPIVAAIIFGG